MLHQRIEEGGVALIAGENLVIQAADVLASEAFEEKDDDVLLEKLESLESLDSLERLG